MKDAVAIAGVAQTPFSKHLPDSERALAARVIVDACADAGIDPAEIDGMTSYTMENNEEVDIAKTVGAGDVTFFAQVGYAAGRGRGASACWPWPWRPASAGSAWPGARASGAAADGRGRTVNMAR